MDIEAPKGSKGKKGQADINHSLVLLNLVLGQHLLSILVSPLLEVADFGPQVLIKIQESKEQGFILPPIEGGME